MQLDEVLRIRIYISLDTLSVHHLVDVVRCDARLELSRGCIEDFPSQSAHLAHRLLLLFVQTSDSIPRSVFVFGVAPDGLSIVWL